MVERPNLVSDNEQNYFLIGDNGPIKDFFGRTIRDVHGARVVSAWLDPIQPCLHVIFIDPDTGKPQPGDFSLKDGASATILGLPKTDHTSSFALLTPSDQSTLH